MEPEINCPENQTLQAGADGTTILPDYVLNNEVTATDNCSENLIIIQDPVAGEAIEVGSNTITFETTCNFSDKKRRGVKNYRKKSFC